jgi:3-hydroxyacyl-CoA dehydrogenase / enoyl-CoA hydratase / 3-hydroxybutyryl-CoA epimerase
MNIQSLKDEQNIVTLTIDMPGRAVNLINPEFFEALQQALDLLAGDQQVAGVILTSGKNTFIAGGDIDGIYQMTDPAATFQVIESFKAVLRRMETCSKPVVAAINGSALGGGLETALACHYRIAVNDPRIKIGFPEVTLGLLPGGGGVVRLTRLLGLQAAFPYLAEGKQVNPQEAHTAGILHELAADRVEMLQKARAWILNNPQAAQPWDQKGYKMPGGDLNNPQVAQMIAVAPGMLLQKTYGNYPAPEAILSVMVDGALVDFDTASRIESRAFTRLATGQTAKNMLQAFWYQLNEIDNGSSRPPGIEPQATRTVGILGAGLMGRGIAYVSAQAGIQVVLKDVTQEQAEAGKAQVAKILDGRLSQGRLTEGEKQAVLDRIQPTAAAADLHGCDLIIEAVFENRELKGRVIQEAEAQIAPDSVFGSNTSTLPISSLAEGSSRPENFIGIHFFSPVHKMKLVEIILGRQTSPRALAKAFDYVLKIRKTPIVVNDSRGFYTSRVFTTFVNEGMALLAEGQPPRAIESAGLHAGMPVGPLAVSDEVNLWLALHIRQQTRQDLAVQEKELAEVPSDAILDLMVNHEKRPGKAQGAGFYEYPPGGKKYLWPRLAELFPLKGERLPLNEMVDRLLFVQVLETVRCFAEGVVTSVGDANIGSIYGWGFAPFKGGTLQFVNNYGLPEFVQRSRELAAKYGERFSPPPLLLQMAEEGSRF